MTYNPVVIDKFPGVNLWEDPGDNPGALLANNVVVGGGRVRTRDGFSLGITGVASDAIKYLHAHTDNDYVTSDQQLIAAAKNGVAGPVYAFNSAGTTLASTTLPGVASSLYATAATIGTATATYTYIVDNLGTGPVRRWDGTTWTSPAAMPTDIGIFSVSPLDNRLVACSRLTSKVSFSDQGAPDTFGANNFVRLTPGDGQVILGAAVFNNQLFVFKNTKFFVFYGTSDNAAAPGTPLFNYRTVDTGIGIENGSLDPKNQTAVGPDGCYFLSRDGIYRTMGGAPTKISGPIDPFFDALKQPSSFWPYGQIVAGLAEMAFFAGKLYVTASWFKSPSQGFLTLVYDPSTGAWVVWPNWPSYPTPLSGGLTPWAGNLWAGVGKDVVVMLPGNTTDYINGVSTAIVSAYRFPFTSFGQPGEKRLRETIVEGSGSPTVQWSKDWGALATGSAVTLGTSPAVATSRQRLAIRGRQLSLQIGASSGAWAVNRVQASIDSVSRPVSVAR